MGGSPSGGCWLQKAQWYLKTTNHDFFFLLNKSALFDAYQDMGFSPNPQELPKRPTLSQICDGDGWSPLLFVQQLLGSAWHVANRFKQQQ